MPIQWPNAHVISYPTLGAAPAAALLIVCICKMPPAWRPAFALRWCVYAAPFGIKRDRHRRDATTCVCLLASIGKLFAEVDRFARQRLNHTDRQTQFLVNQAHLLRADFGEVIVGRDQVTAFALERVQ